MGLLSHDTGLGGTYRCVGGKVAGSVWLRTRSSIPRAGGDELRIFGIRRRDYRLANVFAMCGLCSTPAAHAIVRMKTLLTFFLIPLIPLGSQYRATCAMCGSTSSLTREQSEATTLPPEIANQEPQYATLVAAQPSQGDLHIVRANDSTSLLLSTGRPTTSGRGRHFACAWIR